MITKENAVEMQAKRKNRRGGLSYNPATQMPKTVNSGSNNVKIAIEEEFYWDNAPKPETAEEIKQRIYEWFTHVEELGLKHLPPSMLATALRITQKTFKEWENGYLGDEVAHEIKMALNVLSTINSSNAAAGGNTVWAIFEGKNHYGMSDKQEIEVKVDEPEVEEVIDLDAIAKEYKQYLPPVTEAKAIETSKNT